MHFICIVKHTPNTIYYLLVITDTDKNITIFLYIEI
jgi:hypothetical protein